MPLSEAPLNRSAGDVTAAGNAHDGFRPSEGGSPPLLIYRLSILFLLAVCAAIRLVSLAAKPFWFDECFSAEIARIDWSNFLHLLWWREANMSLYYLLLRLWMHLGQSEFFIRGLSVVFAAATVPALYWVAERLYDRRVALIAAALFAFNAYSVRYSQEARSYALFLLLATLASGFFVVYLQESSRRNRIAYVLASILAVYAHFYALLLVVAHWLALRLRNRVSFNADDRPDLPMKNAWKTIGIAVLPLLIFVVKTGAGPIRWIPRPDLHDLLQFCERLSGGTNWPLAAVYFVACVVAAAPLGKALWARAGSWETWRVQFLMTWLIFPPALTVLLSFARPLFLVRYMIFCLPALLILVAAGLARLQKSWMLAASLVVILLLASQGILFVYGHDYDDERDASGAATNFILDHAQPGDAVVFHIAATRVAYEFFRSVRAGEDTASPSFARQLGPEILFPHDGPGLDYHDYTGKPAADLLRAGAAAHPRLWVMLMYNERDSHADPTTEMMDRSLPESFPKTQRWQFNRVEVRLYCK
jgi:mannosyltransferase